MQRKKWIVTLLTGLVFMTTNHFTAKADTASDMAILMVAPPPSEWQTGPGTGPGKGFSQTGPEIQNGTGEQVVAYAKQFLGNPYVYGGTSLTSGADCSGFVLSVYKQFGINLPRTSEDQGQAGIDVGGIENARPGDLVSYIGHIGIYVGQNQLIHASGPEDGIKISTVDFKPVVSVRRVLGN
ncbi:C40 family peptidase [Lacrimispora indolis]|uniref:C40 family peptidase n=1 Tax=Lacrimispora indolis TaxID=69825 RepID=UPI00045EBF00|nr:C40 family peptidase [Lacrimispora indolis]